MEAVDTMHLSDAADYNDLFISSFDPGLDDTATPLMLGDGAPHHTARRHQDWPGLNIQGSSATGSKPCSKRRGGLFALLVFGLVTCTVIVVVLLKSSPSPPLREAKVDSESHPNGTAAAPTVFRFVATPQTWHEAEQTCSEWGGHLATIRDAQDNAKATQLCAAQRCWIGISDLETEGRWFWNGGGAPDTYANWKPGTPDNGAAGGLDEDCGYMYGTQYHGGSNAGLWNDKVCQERYAALCSRDARLQGGGLSTCQDYKSQANCYASPDTVDSIVKKIPLCDAIEKEQSKDTARTSFAVVGDFGLVSAGCEEQVGVLVRALDQLYHLSAVVSTGDNAYWEGSCSAYLDSVGPVYGMFFDNEQAQIGCNLTATSFTPPPQALVQSLVRDNKFWPVIGNHDWHPQMRPSAGEEDWPLPIWRYLPAVAARARTAQMGQLDADMLGGLRGYYSTVLADGLVELFMLNSNLNHPHSEIRYETANIAQEEWFVRASTTSQARWKLVVMHHPPYSTAIHDPPAVHMRMPFAEYGIHAVLSGHQHVYERIEMEGEPVYLTNGLGGHPWRYDIHDCKKVQQGSVLRYNSAHGAMLMRATLNSLQACFYSVEQGASLVDSFAIT